MAIFQSKKFRPSSASNTSAQRLRNAVARHPFALFGLPFIATMVAGSFFLTPATALRYERHDNKVRQLTREEGLGIGQNKRKVDLRDEYYVRSCLPLLFPGKVIDNIHSDLPVRIWMIGSRSGSRDCLERSTESWSERAGCWKIIYDSTKFA